MQITFASYNIHKAVGTDGRRDPDRILSVLREIDADVIALQEADRRFGDRASVIPRHAIDEHSPWRAVALGGRPDSIGWHGNALLVRRGIEVTSAAAVPLPMLEPRGAVSACLMIGGQSVTVVGMHLDLSGIRRRHQLRTVLDHAGSAPAVLMGDFNQWTQARGAMREFGTHWQVLDPGRSFPSRQPVARLDRIVASSHWHCLDTAVHHSALSAKASDHLPVFSRLILA